MKQSSVPIISKLKKIKDERGSFMEVSVEKEIERDDIDFVQENQSISKKNVLRGLHFQFPHFQGKLIRVIKGSILDVYVDLRPSSKDYLKANKILLSDENNLCLYIPSVFAHGFLSLEDDTIVSYKCTDYYYPKEQHGIIWNDSSLNVDWEINPNKIILSEKDKALKPLIEALDIIYNSYRRKSNDK